MKFTIGVASDDLVDLNGEHYDEPPGSGVVFALPSGETVEAVADYESSWVIKLTLPDGTTHDFKCSCCGDGSCTNCQYGEDCRDYCRASHG